MFGFLDMMGNYEDRKVDLFEGDGELLIDTCSVTDGAHDYETAVAHPYYNGGKWVIVQAYDSEEEARQGHDKWVSIMTANELPNELIDCANSATSRLVEGLGGQMTYPKET